MPALAVPVAQRVVRSFDMGGGMGTRDRDLADASPFLSVVGRPGDSVADWLSAGQALQQALLVGLSRGLQSSHLNQPVQAEPLWPRMQALCDGVGVPQLLLRWGRSDTQLPATPRRPLADVMLHSP